MYHFNSEFAKSCGLACDGGEIGIDMESRTIICWEEHIWDMSGMDKLAGGD